MQTKDTPIDQSSLGLTLVQLMVKQIAGTITIHSDHQMAVLIRFKDNS
jgi:two-component sensor histidine kinase